jgi:hypothetical protein
MSFLYFKVSYLHQPMYSELVCICSIHDFYMLFHKYYLIVASFAKCSFSRQTSWDIEVFYLYNLDNLSSFTMTLIGKKIKHGKEHLLAFVVLGINP